MSDVSILHVLLCSTPLALVGLASYSMGLKLESPLLVGCIRTFLQLALLALSLKPIFIWGEEYWEIVVMCHVPFPDGSNYLLRKRSAVHVLLPQHVRLCAWWFSHQCNAGFRVHFWDHHSAATYVGSTVRYSNGRNATGEYHQWVLSCLEIYANCLGRGGIRG